MEQLSLFVQYIITGLSTGSIYALIAIGFVTIYNITGIVNFAQGEFSMLGALICITFYNAGLPIWASAIISILLTALIGLVIQRVTISPVKNASFLILIIITIGVSILFRGLGLVIWGTFPLSLPAFSSSQPIQLLGAVIIPQNIWIISVLLIMLVLLYIFFEKTFIGHVVKACVNNAKTAQLMGINPKAMAGLAFALSASIGAIAGILIAPMTGGFYDMGFLLGLKGFVAMVIGGMGSVSGAVLGGLILGIVEALAGGYISTSYSDAISFTVLLIFLFFMPNGLLAQATGKRV
jgi:branched-chain amino acid transport system permease protein